MKILFFHEYTSISGGTDTVVNTELKGLKQAGIDVKCLSYYNKDFLQDSFFNKIKTYSKSCFGILLVKKLQTEIENFKPDIIHFHNIYQIFRSPIWNDINPGNAKLVLHMHNYYPFCLNALMYRHGYCTECYVSNKWRPGVVHKCFNNSFIKSFMVSLGKLPPEQWLSNISKLACIIVVSNFLFTKLADLGVSSSEMEILNNCVKVNDINNKGNYILYLGNISVEKGVPLFCETAKKLPGLKFIAAGDGVKLKELKHKYLEVKNLEFTGYVTGFQKENLLRGCRFLYFPTQCLETFGLVVLEAFSFGKPVLTTGYGATKELVKNGVTGIINPDTDINSQLSSVLELWNETGEKEYYSNNCFELSKRYSTQKHIKQLITIYKGLL